MSGHERERLSAWLDGELAPAERAEVETHLAACPECTALLAEMGALDEAARALPVEAPSGYFETFPERVRARIETESPARARPDAPPPRWRIPVWTWAAAAVLLLAVVTPLTLDRLDRDGALLARAPKAAPVSRAPAALEPSETVAPAKPSEVGLPATPVSNAERDEAGLADPDLVLEARVRQDVAREQPAFAAPPAPEPKRETVPGPGVSSAAARTGELANAPAAAGGRASVSAADAAPTAAVVFEGESVGEALEEAPPNVPEPRRQAVMRDVVTPAAAPPAVTSPAKGRMAAPQAAEVQGGLSVEKKTVPEDTLAYARLDRGAPEDATAWREHREEWRSFAIAHPQSRHVDEARVRVIEAGIEAWRAGGDPEDLAGARADADEYLARDDARQKARVRRGLKTAPESPR